MCPDTVGDRFPIRGERRGNLVLGQIGESDRSFRHRLARERSATFRRLIESIETTDGLIYIIEGQCPRGVGACLHLSVEIAGPRRLLRIFVNPHWYPSCEMVEAIAHELQHAREALADKKARTTIGLFRLFERIGPTGSGTFETQDALDMGTIVEREACGKTR